ncbi:substrate-binding domain-containing protein [Streptomyces sp. NPDC004542]|uniref:substrate-binding domain-containing protein n=1 Tax=Streptomyces sp. NPDC004542 TaxID=3154281 RepID=UPI0033BB1F48
MGLVRSRRRAGEISNPQEDVGRKQAEYLLGRGHTRLGYALPSDDRLRAFYEPRLVGVRECCARAGLPEPVEQVVPMESGAAGQAVAGWAGAGGTGVCAYNDETALAVLAGARETGTAVPSELAVIGVDDIPLASLVSPRLTSVRVDMRALARELVAPLAEEAAAASAGEGATTPAAGHHGAQVVVRESTQ